MPDPAVHASAAYATFTRRLRALVLDSVVLVAGLIVIVLASELTRDVAGSSRVLAAALFAMVLLYEPLMVWRLGGTVGHLATNLRVVDDASGGNPGLLRAAARFWIKAALGLLSFVSMALTRRHQAVHDSLTRTTVQIRDLTKAQPDDYLTERPAVESASMPSRARRVLVVLGYQVVLFLAVSISVTLLVPSACLEADRCTPGEEVVMDVVGFAWIGASLLCLVAGWRGRLWGARARPEPPAAGSADA
jgi:uncharacterized RDD family membrane protein YckC